MVHYKYWCSIKYINEKIIHADALLSEFGKVITRCVVVVLFKSGGNMMVSSSITAKTSPFLLSEVD